MTQKQKKLAAIAALVVLAGWLIWFCQPERQVLRHQTKIITALENREFGTFSSLIATEYKDQWGNNQMIVRIQVREIIKQFTSLSIQRGSMTLEQSGNVWQLSESIQLHGAGEGLARIAAERVNQLESPFVFTWKRGFLPWNYELIAVKQPELSLHY